MTMPFLAIYLYQSKGMEAALIGTVIGASFLVGMFSSFLGGLWSDRLGRFPVMAVSLLGWSLTFVGFALVDSFLGFLAVSAGNGFFRNLFEPTSKALITDITPPEKQMSVFNARYLAINAGAAIGPLAGVYVGSAKTTEPFFITAGICLLYLLLTTIVRLGNPMAKAAEDRASLIPFRQALEVVVTDKAFLGFLVGNALVYAAYAHMESTLAQYVANAPGIKNGIHLFSYLVLTNTVTVLALQMPLLGLFRKVPPVVSLQIGAILFGIGLAGFGCVHSLVGMILSMVVFTMGEILSFVTGEMVISQLAPDHLHGTYFGASGFAFIGQSIGPWLGGWLLDLLGFSQGGLIFTLLMIVTWCAVPFYLFAQRQMSLKNQKVGV